MEESGISYTFEVSSHSGSRVINSAATDCMAGNLNDFHSIIPGTKFGIVKVADESLTTIDGKGDVNFSCS